jgi:hypothetical protein
MNILKELDKYLLKEVYDADQRPIRALVYGVAGILLTGIIVFAMAWLFRKP